MEVAPVPSAPARAAPGRAEEEKENCCCSALSSIMGIFDDMEEDDLAMQHQPAAQRPARQLPKNNMGFAVPSQLRDSAADPGDSGAGAPDECQPSPEPSIENKDGEAIQNI